jgi:predicted unusual protein kinase regulating ubiquinone biosynthesis (AarF/ABC1/UbiB family)
MPEPAKHVPHGRIRRTMPLAGFTAQAASGRLLAGIRERAGHEGEVRRFHERTAERYTELLGHSKGALMKVGQMMSMVDSRALGTGGFWPYQNAMSRLHADAPPMHPDLVHEVLAAELGLSAAPFADFTDTPIAAASIGQVHRAVLHDGRQVAVKIQYPGVAQAIHDDLANTELLATFLRFMTSAAGVRLDVRAVAREAAARISEELDYRHEAATIATFSRLYQDHPFIRVPDVHHETSSDRVLTMTYLDGMDWAAAQHAEQDLKNTWAETVIRFNQGSFRYANLLHADPHPGNYRFNTDGSVGFVDFGCVKVLPEPQRWRLVAMTRAVIDGRKDDYRDLMVQAGFLDSDSDVSSDELYQWQAEALYEIVAAPQPATYSPQTTGRVMRAYFDVRGPEHPLGRMNAPDDFVFASRTTFALNAVTAGLGATLPMRAIMDDLDDVAEPVTELGKLHRGWVHDRHLPSALTRHDRP